MIRKIFDLKQIVKNFIDHSIFKKNTENKHKQNINLKLWQYIIMELEVTK